MYGNCRLPSEVVLFSRSERNSGNFLTICQIFQFPVFHQPKTITRNQIANGKAPSRSVGLLVLEKPLPLFNGRRDALNGHPNRLPFAKLSSFQSLISRKQCANGKHSFGWFADFGLFNGSASSYTAFNPSPPPPGPREPNLELFPSSISSVLQGHRSLGFQLSWLFSSSFVILAKSANFLSLWATFANAVKLWTAWYLVENSYRTRSFACK